MTRPFRHTSVGDGQFDNNFYYNLKMQRTCFEIGGVLTITSVSSLIASAYYRAVNYNLTLFVLFLVTFIFTVVLSSYFLEKGVCYWYYNKCNNREKNIGIHKSSFPNMEVVKK